MGRLAGKVAVVLGAAGQDNMGQVMARRFAEEGATVVVAGRRSEPLEALAAEIGGSAALCDITNKAQVDALAATALERHGRLDVAVNCTGWGLLVLQTFVGRMAQLGGGSVITLSSASVHAVLHHHAAYIATKAAGEAMVRCFANEFGHRGVKVNALAPGLTESPMTAREMSLPGLRETFVKEYPLGRIGTGLDVANAALWLASDESFMTGEVLQVNGGLTLRRNPSPSEINAALKAGRTAAAG